VKFLIVYPTRDGHTTVRLTSDPNELIRGPFEGWALHSRKQILFVKTKIGPLLGGLHRAGAFLEDGATYALGYQDMLAILRESLGPTDRERFEAALALVRKPVCRMPYRPSADLMTVVSLAGNVFSILGSLLRSIGHMAKFVAVVVLVPLAILLIDRRR